MSKIDYQALREAAEKATPGRVGDRIDGSGSIKYECHGYDGSLVLRTDHKNMEYGFIGDNSNADELFFRLCVPDVILALLDELDKWQQESSAWQAVAEKQLALAEDAEKRITELEAREVVLPRAHDVHPLGPQSAKIFCEFHRSIVNRCADEIRKVGVKVSIKGN